MYEVNGYNISIPRGDSASLAFELTDAATGEPYMLADGRYAVFAVFPVKGAKPVISKTLTEQTESGAVIAELMPEDSDIPRGSYIYTLRLYNADNTEIDTVAGFPETAGFEVM